MNNARQILIQIHAVMGSAKKTEREVDEFCSWIEVQVMTELFEGLPKDKQDEREHPHALQMPDFLHVFVTRGIMRERREIFSQRLE